MFSATVNEQELAAAVKAFTLKPYPSRIFIWELKMPEKTESGLLFLPEVNKNVQEFYVTEGIVMDVGVDIDFCKRGDHVFYAKYSGALCNWNGIQYRVMNEADLFGSNPAGRRDI